MATRSTAKKQKSAPKKKSAAKKGGGLGLMKMASQAKKALSKLGSELKGAMKGVQKPKGDGKITHPPSAKKAKRKKK